MGYLRGLLHGAVIGTAVGIVAAPQKGTITRKQLASAGRSARQGYEAAERTVRRVSPLVAPLAERFRHTTVEEAEVDEVVTVHGKVRIHDDTGHNGHRTS